MSDFKILTDEEIDALEADKLEEYTKNLKVYNARMEAKRLSQNSQEAQKQEAQINENRETGKVEDSKDENVTEAEKEAKFTKDVIAELDAREKQSK